MDNLDSHTVERIEGITSTKDLKQFSESTDNIIDNLINEGFDSETIYEYLRGKIIEKLEDYD